MTIGYVVLFTVTSVTIGLYVRDRLCRWNVGACVLTIHTTANINHKGSEPCGMNIMDG